MRRSALLAACATLCFPALTWASELEAYWYGFKRYWYNLFGSQDGVSMVVLAVLVVSIFIITRGRWGK